MTETVSRSASADGWNEPTKHLPPLETRELPEPLPLRKLIGASVILLATALGSGELLIWPYITTQAGVGLLWLATLGFLSQYFLNMEIERYTLATGETAVTGFSRFWKPWGVVFALGAILPNAFPGWAASAATSLTFLTGWGESTIPWLVTIILLSIGLAITVSLSILAIMSLIASFVWGIGSIVAVIMGHAALREIERSGGTRTGRPVAVAGLAIGYFGLITMVAAILSSAA